MMRKHAIVAGLLCWVACGASLVARAQHSDAPGIDWFKGDVPAAFAAAAQSHKPVFLYWGAKWCPPCQQLKSSVFSRSDFIAKTRQFVPVYLDGDAPGAQKWGETFHVSGYPTVVILRSDRREITRISGGVDLSQYADLLDAALGDVKPIGDVLGDLQHNPSRLTAADCQRLAYYAWEVGDVADGDKPALGQSLDQAATNCPGLNAVERARLTVIAGIFAPSPAATTQILALVADPAIAPKIVDALEGLSDAFFTSVHKRRAVVAAKFERDWSAAMDVVANDPKVIPAEQLAAFATKLALVKQFAAHHRIPAALAADGRARVAAALQKSTDPYVRAGIVNSASYVYEELGDTTSLYAMLNAELKTAKAPYYYMADLGEIEEKRGAIPRALAWYERAYRESQGIATRFQWGSLYLNALLRLTPKDHAKIRAVGLEVIAELDGPDRIQARTRRRLESLDEHLRHWSAKQRAVEDIRVLHSRMSDVCEKLPSEDSGRPACQKFLTT
jgi:thiol-disulfide isomerase/thioredoxin